MLRLWLACALVCAACGHLAHLPAPALTARCAADALTVSFDAQPTGSRSLYAVGFPRACRSLRNATQLRIPLHACGVRLEQDDNDQVSASVWLRVQSDAQLQQAGDPLRRVACTLPATEGMPTQGLPANQGLPTQGLPATEGMPANARRGRKMPERTAQATLLLDGLATRGHVSVGETVLLSVRARLPRGVDGRVVDCAAHDGAGESAQPLIDGQGCAVDKALLPELTYRAVTPSRREAVIATARFAAFKFPDMRSLHIRCSLRLCAGTCTKPDCANAASGRGNQSADRGNQSTDIGRVALFNSIEVRAPGIDLASDQLKAPTEEVPAERTVCLSAGKMAASLAALGLVFLVAAAAALCIALGRRRERWPAPRFVRL